jgi:hypothetical protein
MRISPLTIFLAKLLWLYCIIVALAMIPRKQSAVAAKALVRKSAASAARRSVGSRWGLALIIGHNIWPGGVLLVVVTLVGRLMAIRGDGPLALAPSSL